MTDKTRITPRYYRVRQICELLGVSKARVFQALRAGKIEGLKLDGTLLIPVESLERFLSTARPWSGSKRDDGREESQQQEREWSRNSKPTHEKSK